MALPDHRIPPDCSRAQFETYIEVFAEVFGSVGDTASGGRAGEAAYHATTYAAGR